MFLETSAKTAINVVEAFNLSAQSILNHYKESGADPNSKSNINLKNDITSPGGISGGPEQKKGCC